MPTLWIYFFIAIPWTWLSCPNKFLVEAMFEKLDLPKPVYFMHALEQGGYVSDVRFYPTKKDLCVSSEQTFLSSPVCKDGVTSMNHATAQAIRFMERREHMVLVDYNYEQLQQEDKANADITNKLLQEEKEISQHKKTIKQMTREASDYVDEVRFALNEIHVLAGASLDPTAPMTVCNLKKNLLKIHDSVVALQNITSTTCLSLQKKGIYPYDTKSDSGCGQGSNDDMGDSTNYM